MSASLLALVAFLVTTIGLSFALDLWVPYRARRAEQVVMRIGLGLGVMIVLAVLLDLLSIPLDLRLFVGLALALTAIQIVRRRGAWLGPAGPVTRRDLLEGAVVGALFLGAGVMYVGGAFQYGHLEDGDPWKFTAVSRVISELRTFTAPYRYNHTAEPYPQGYQVVMALMHQASGSIYLTMKLIHNLVLALSIPWFYWFARELLRRREHGRAEALAATVVLFALPSWLSHFLFSFSFNLSLMLVLLYSLRRVEQEPRGKLVVALMYAAILVTHAFSAVVITMILGLYYLARVLARGELSGFLPAAGVAGFALSLAFFVPAVSRHPVYLTDGIVEGLGGYEVLAAPVYRLFQRDLGGALVLSLGLALLLAAPFLPPLRGVLTRALRPAGVRGALAAAGLIGYLALVLVPEGKLIPGVDQQDRLYTLADFAVATADNEMPNPFGWGAAALVLVILGGVVLIARLPAMFRERRTGELFLAMGLLFFLVQVHGERLALQFFAHRMWTFLAPFAAFTAGLGLIAVERRLPLTIRPWFIAAAAAAVLATSFRPKYEFNVEKYWPDHEITLASSYPAFEYVREQLPADARVLWGCGPAYILCGYDALPPLVDPEISAPWELPDQDKVFHERFLAMPLDELHEFLRRKQVDYVLFGGGGLRRRARLDRPDLARGLFEFAQQKAARMREPGSGFELRTETPSDYLFQVTERAPAR